MSPWANRVTMPRRPPDGPGSFLERAPDDITAEAVDMIIGFLER